MANLSEEQQRQLFKLRAEYKQLVEPNELHWPDGKLLLQYDVQTWLYSNLFDEGTIQYLPPPRYRMRVLKTLLSKIEAAIEDPEEEEVSDDLMNALGEFLGAQLPSEAMAAQQKAFVSYTFNGQDTATFTSSETSVTLLESRSIISSEGTTGMRTWEAALHLGAYLATTEGRKFVQDKVILELGAGTALLSILAAKHLGASHVMATDGTESVVEAVESNIFLNGLTNETIKSASLKWGYPLDETSLEEDYSSGSLETILATDVTYDPAIIPTLVLTLTLLLDMRPTCQALIGATVRNEKTWETFRTTAKRYGLNVEDVSFEAPEPEHQSGPFYATRTPLRIVRINKPADA